MNTINQTDTILKKIKAKQTLGLPLTARETALLALYGTTEREEVAGNIADEESARKARFVAEYLSPLCGRRILELQMQNIGATPKQARRL